MNKNILFLALLFILSPTLQAQKLSVAVNYTGADNMPANNILYRPGIELNWTDFKGTPPMGNDAAALTNAGFGMKLAFKSLGATSQLVIEVNCSFSRKDSWVKPAYKNIYILNHEQRHFDIAFIHTCLFIQLLRKASFTNTNYATVIEKVYRETALAMTNMQNQYDGETSHSRIPEKQAEWDKIISDQLSQALKMNVSN